MSEDTFASVREIVAETLGESWRARFHVRLSAMVLPAITHATAMLQLADRLKTAVGPGRRAGEPRQAWCPIIVAWDDATTQSPQFVDALRQGEANRTLIWGGRSCDAVLIAGKERETRLACTVGSVEEFFRLTAQGIALSFRPGECPDFPFPNLVRAITQPPANHAVYCTIDGDADRPVSCHAAPLWEQGSEGEMLIAPQERRIKLYRPERGPCPNVLSDVIGHRAMMAGFPGLAAWPCGRAKEIGGGERQGVVTPDLGPYYRPLSYWIDSPTDLGLVDSWKKPVWPRLLSVADGLAQAVGCLHDVGLVHGDINHSNVLVDWRRGDVQLVDLDGVAPPGNGHRQPKGRWGFAAPEVVAGQPPDQYAERHALALTIAWTLLLRNVMLPLNIHIPEDQLRDEQVAYGPAACFSEHPYDPRNRPPGLGRPLFQGGVLSCTALPDALLKLLERSFIEGLHCPTRRPTAAEWRSAFAEARQHMMLCPLCGQVTFRTSRSDYCPFCGDEL